MEVFEAIKKRHSYRGPFIEKPISKKDLEKIVSAGIRAPSGKNAQMTSFVIVDDKKILKEIGQMHAMKAMQTAQAMVVCIIDKDPEAIYEGHNFQVEDCAAAVENILIAITSLGFATVWIDGWLRLDGRAEKIERMLGVPDDKTIRVLLPVGTPQESCSQKEKKPFEERAWFNQFGKKE